MKKKKIMALAVAVSVTITSLAGCSFKSDTPLIGKIVGLKSNEIFQVDELICSKPEYMLVLMNTENQYKSDFGGAVDWNAKVDDKVTLQSYVIEKVKEDISVKYTLAAMAEKKSIMLTEQEKNKIAKVAGEYFNSLSAEEKDYTKASESDVEKVYTNYLLADKVYSKLTEAVGTKISDEEARTIKIQYIRMSTANNKESKITSTLQNVVDLVKGGYQQFSREAKQYTEDDVVEKVLKKNEVTQKYEKEAFNLNSKEMSGIIQDGNNYYLIYCVESYMKEDTAQNKQKIINSAKDEYFNKQYNDFLNDVETDFNEDASKSIKLSESSNVKNTALMEKYKSMNDDK